MPTDRDTTRIVRSWLEDGATALPDRVLDAVLDQVPATRQRRSWWPAWRFADMNPYAKFAIAAAAVVVVAVIGLNLLLPRETGVGGGGPAPSEVPSSIPTQGATSSAAPSGTVTLTEGALDPGVRYLGSFDMDVRGYPATASLTFDVPTTGWSFEGNALDYQDATDRGLLRLFPTGFTPGIFTDMCAHEGLQQFDDSIAGEAEAYASIPGVALVDGPSDVTVDGRAAKSVTIHVPEDVGCENSEFWMTHEPECGARLGCTYYPSWLDNTMRYWIVDLGDEGRFTVLVESTTPASPEFEGQLQEIVDSIQFE